MGYGNFDLNFGAIDLLLAAPVPIAICIGNEAGYGVSHVNPAFTELTGYTSEECLGQRRGFLAGPRTDAKTLAEIHDDIDQGRPVRRDLMIYHRDGTPFWVELAVSPLRHTDHGVILTLVDARQRYQAAADFHETAAFLEGVVKNMPGFIYRRILRADGTIEYFGVPGLLAEPGANALKPMPVDPFRFLHHTEVERYTGMLDQSLETLGPFHG